MISIERPDDIPTKAERADIPWLLLPKRGHSHGEFKWSDGAALEICQRTEKGTFGSSNH